MRLPSVSIVIPLHVDGETFRRDLAAYGQLEYPGDVQLIIVSDRAVAFDGLGADVVLTGKELTGPGEKRDAALSVARGQILAYIDDDARPHPQWLLRGMRHFDNPKVGAVGGPGLTPPEDDFWQRAGGAVYESFLGSGPLRYRFAPHAPRLVDDYPAYNLLVRRAALEQVGGWDSTFYGGEDTKLCLALVQGGWHICYDPEAIVYHHRRPLFRGHLKQIGNVGVHRGYFVNAFPETSRRLSYFLPAAVIIGALAGGLLALLTGTLTVAQAGVLALLLWALATLSAWRTAPASLPIALVAGLGIWTTHLVYAAGFLRGLTVKEMTR